MIDAEVLIHRLLTRDFPDWKVLPDIDVDSISSFPFLTHTIAVGQSIDNAWSPQGWSATLSLNLFDDSLDGAKANAFALYDAVHAWLDPFTETYGHIADVGFVADITSESIFTREQTAEVSNKWVTQYAGSFELTLRPER